MRLAGLSLTSMKFVFFTPLAFALLLFSGVSARAQNPGLIDGFNDWSAFSVKQDGKPVCYIGSEPIKSVGKYSKRGDVLFLVTHRPADKLNGVINFQTGYTFKTGADVTLSVGKATFTLFTDDQDAWALDAKSDQAIIIALIKGARMVITGTSSRGTKTTDTFSLKGFSAAYKAASKACKV